MSGPDRVVLLNDFSSAQGGAGYLASTLATELAARGQPVAYLCGDGGGEPLPGVETVALGGTRLVDGRRFGAGLRGLHNRDAARQVRDWMARSDTPRTVYHLHNWSNILSPSVFDALAPVANRCVIHAHDFFLACPNGAFLDYPRAAVCDRTPLSAGCIVTNCDKRAYAHKLWRVTRQKMLGARLRPHLDAATFVLIHEAMRPLLGRRIAPRRMVAIGNPVTPFGPVVTAPSAGRRLVHIGQIQRLKGVYELAEAGRRLGAPVDFFGAGEDLDDLKARYPEHAWHGFTPRADIGRHLRTARAVVVATQSPEPFCLAAFESVATGLPLVVSDAILASQELVEGGAALSFRAGHVDSLTRVLGRVLSDDLLVERLARAARDRGATLGAGLPAWVDAHRALYDGLLRNAPRHDAVAALTPDEVR